MDRFRIPPVFALAALTACASHPNHPPVAESPPAVEPRASLASGGAPASENTLVPASSEIALDPDDPRAPAPSTSSSDDTPGVSSGAVVVRGELHPTRVHAAMRAAYPAIHACHREALEKAWTEDKPVRVQLNFVITEQGSVTKLTDDTANLNPLFSSCVLRVVIAVTFPHPKQGTVSVTYPLLLTKS
jgi:hypothetical protein